MPWLTVAEYLWQKWSRICSGYGNHNPLFHAWLITEFIIRVTRRVPPMEQELQVHMKT